MSLLDNPEKFMNVPPHSRAFQSVLQAMAFVSCEFNEELGDDAAATLTYTRLKQSTLVTKYLSASSHPSQQNG